MARPRKAELGEPRQCARCREFKPFTIEFWKPNSSGNKHAGKKFHNFRAYCRICIGKETAYYNRTRLWRAKREAIDHYGGCCVCCGEITLEFLTFDHIDGGGSQHRREIPKVRKHIHLWLKQNNYPPIVRILCWNCHMARNGGRICPHMNGITGGASLHTECY